MRWTTDTVDPTARDPDRSRGDEARSSASETRGAGNRPPVGQIRRPRVARP